MLKVKERIICLDFIPPGKGFDIFKKIDTILPTCSPKINKKRSIYDSR
jgi:hypothetical protein